MNCGGVLISIEHFAFHIYFAFFGFDRPSAIVSVFHACDIIWVIVVVDQEIYQLPLDTVLWDTLLDWVDIYTLEEEDWYRLLLAAVEEY